jgi:hypothetical protein
MPGSGRFSKGSRTAMACALRRPTFSSWTCSATSSYSGAPAPASRRAVAGLSGEESGRRCSFASSSRRGAAPRIDLAAGSGQESDS